MNRAASFLWATTVALVLSTSAYAEKKVLRFPTPVKMTGTGSKVAGSAETVDVPTQVIRNRAATRQAQWRPRAGSRIPRNVTKINYKKALKYNPARAIAGVVISGAVGAVGWVMSEDNTKLRRIEQEAPPVPVATFGYGFSSTGCTGPWDSAESFMSCYQARSDAVDGRWNYPYTVAPYNNGGLKITYQKRYKSNGSLVSTGEFIGNKVGNCAPPLVLNASYKCVNPAGNIFTDVTDSDLDAFVSSVDSLDDARLQSLFDDLALVDPAFGMLMPEYLRSADGATAEQLATNPLITNIARLNTDGSVSRLTKTEQATFNLTYPETGTEINYTVTNKTTITNEAGEVVEETTETEESAEEAPELSNALDSANDPLKDWATGISDIPSQTISGTAYPLLFTYGGTCSMPALTLPYLGTFGLDPICTAINDYVKPILAVLFAAWTTLHIFGVWRETTMQVRPA